jgi:hypothetical protein
MRPRCHTFLLVWSLFVQLRSLQAAFWLKGRARTVLRCSAVQWQSSYADRHPRVITRTAAHRHKCISRVIFFPFALP